MIKIGSNYPYKTLALLEPAFNTRLTSLIIDLNILREKRLYGSTPPQIFFQLKHLFHILESIGSARIEGNHTTILEFIDSKIEKKIDPEEGVREIQNVERALSYVDQKINHTHTFQIDGIFLKELHKIVVDNLSISQEGDRTPGSYRGKHLVIQGASHVPPEPAGLPYYMDELITFINQENEPKYDLLKIALAHHRFVWIHPFGNGNGRTVRLLTYAQLVRSGFKVDAGGRIINPTTVFCSDREKYYEELSKADSGTSEGLLSWCEYVLEGLKEEIEKIDKLANYNYLASEILLPAVAFALEREWIIKLESEVLKVAIEKQLFESADVAQFFPNKASSHISRFIRNMRHKKLITPETPNGRKYIINFEDNYLIRAVIEMLGQKGFLPPEL